MTNKFALSIAAATAFVALAAAAPALAGDDSSQRWISGLQEVAAPATQTSIVTVARNPADDFIANLRHLSAPAPAPVADVAAKDDPAREFIANLSPAFAAGE